MRYWISAMLLATAAAVPAYAQDNGFGDRGGHHDGGGQQDGGHRDGGPQQGDGHHNDSQHNGAQPGGRGAVPQAQPQRPVQNVPPQGGYGGRPDGGHMRPEGSYAQGGRPQVQVQQAPQGNRPDPRNGGIVQVWRNQYDARNGNAPRDYDQQHGRPDYNQSYQGDPHGYQQNYRGNDHRGDNGYRGDNDHRGDNGYRDDRGQRSAGDWNRGWRQDHRYDWQGWRNSHRDIFRGGYYRPPYGGGYGYGYQRFGIGAEIDAAFFAQQYWIADPWEYRLPPAYEPYRWVRYYNDALLIDLETGQIVDAIPSFFY